jgi:hypothetical protein
MYYFFLDSSPSKVVLKIICHCCAVYNMDGTQLLKIENYVVPKRTLYMPHPASHFPWVDQEYDARGRPTKWEWGGKKEVIKYDTQARRGLHLGF